MNIALFGHRFFLFGGGILIACAVLQILIRPRTQEKGLMPRFVNGTTLRAFFFVTVGVLAILVGTGAIPMTGGR
jgi:hypothetical protein